LAFGKFSLLYFLRRLIAPGQQAFLWLMRISWVIMGLYLVGSSGMLGIRHVALMHS
jgi:hypothetical protein